MDEGTTNRNALGDLGETASRRSSRSHGKDHDTNRNLKHSLPQYIANLSHFLGLDNLKAFNNNLYHGVTSYPDH